MPGIDRVIQSIRCGDDEEMFEDILKSSGVNIRAAGEQLLVEAADSNREDVALHLIKRHRVNPLTARNKEGRKIDHIAILRDHQEFSLNSAKRAWCQNSLLNS